MEIAYIVIFWYGILHAFAPDHLTAITDFSIGKSIKRTMTTTIMFAFGHGMMLFIFAKILEIYSIPSYITEYGDIISSMVIISMGLYLLLMVWFNRIHLDRHIHHNEEHIHIYFGKEHSHDGEISTLSAWSVGALMGIGGVRGMLVTLGMIGSGSVDLGMVLAFVAGVSIVFVSFGISILYLNREYLKDISQVRRVFTIAGVLSVVVGMDMLLL